MSLICDRCGKSKVHGRKIGRARQELNYRSSRVFNPNVHSFKGELGGKKGNWKLCTKCLRLVKKQLKSKSDPAA